MQLPLQSFTSLVQQMAAGVQGSAKPLIDLSVGSVLRALLESCASLALWLQWVALQVLSATRAATSQGADLESWMADFSLLRLPGSPASGVVMFSRYTGGIQAAVPVGTTVRTLDGSLSFTVVADATNPVWNGSDGYLLPALLLNAGLPVQANATGLTGNVQPGAIALLSVALPGIDTVTNAAGFAGGAEGESDGALRARFVQYINSRSLATIGAVEFAVASVRPGVRYQVFENSDLSGVTYPGHFCVVVDDGSGNLPASLLSEVITAVDAVRPVGSSYSVLAPIPVVVSVSLALETSSPNIAIAVGQAVASWIAGLPIGGTLAISKLDSIAHATSSAVTRVTLALIDGSAADIVAPKNGVFVATAISVI